MPVNINAWRKVVEQGVEGIANEELQRRAWFGVGREESSNLIEELLNQMPKDYKFIDRSKLLDDPKCKEIRKAATRFLKFLKEAT